MKQDNYWTAREKVDELIEEYSDVLPDEITKEFVWVYVADWKRRLGYASYNTRVLDNTFGKKVPGSKRETVVGEMSIGIANRNFEGDWEDTIRHELAHLADHADRGTSGHGTEWKIWADKLDADPTRTSDHGKKNVKYYVCCVECGYETGRVKKSKTVKKPWKYLCPKCESRCSSYPADGEKPTGKGMTTIPEILSTESTEVTETYTVTCVECEYKVGRDKRSKIVQYPERYGCPWCDDSTDLSSYRTGQVEPDETGVCFVDCSDL